VTSISIVRGSYKTVPYVADYAVLSHAGQPILEFHNRRLVRLLSPEMLHQILHQYAIDAGLL
jgi:hypothetical protein